MIAMITIVPVLINMGTPLVSAGLKTGVPDPAEPGGMAGPGGRGAGAARGSAVSATW